MPLDTLHAEIAARRAGGARRIGLIGFSAGGHLAGLATLTPGATAERDGGLRCSRLRHHLHRDRDLPPARLILLGENASPRLRHSTSLDALVTPQSPPFFVWHTSEDPYVPPEHTDRFASALAASQVPHAVHVFTHGPHGLGLAQDAAEAAAWTTLASARIHEQASR